MMVVLIQSGKFLETLVQLEEGLSWLIELSQTQEDFYIEILTMQDTISNH